MLEDGMEKVINGTTTLSELERVIEITLAPTTKNEENSSETDLFLSHVVT
jgi:hypothetical protein